MNQTATPTDTIDKERNQEIANTTLSQMGGRRFQMMTGAQASHADGVLNILLPRGKAKDKINVVTITLDPSDTYTVTFEARWYRIKTGFGQRTIATVENVYCDQLQDIFTEYTGLYTSL